MPGCTMETEGGHTKVYTPFNQDFISAAKASGAKWDVGAGAWIWPANRAEDAAAAHEQVFGFQPASADVDMNDMTEVRVVVTEFDRSDKDGFYLLGRKLAGADGRKSYLSSGVERCRAPSRLEPLGHTSNGRKGRVEVEVGVVFVSDLPTHVARSVDLRQFGAFRVEVAERHCEAEAAGIAAEDAVLDRVREQVQREALRCDRHFDGRSRKQKLRVFAERRYNLVGGMNQLGLKLLKLSGEERGNMSAEYGMVSVHRRTGFVSRELGTVEVLLPAPA